MNLPQIKRHTFFGNRYLVKFGSLKQNTTEEELNSSAKKYGINSPDDILALTDDHDIKGKTILVSDAIEDDKELMRVLLDEGLHACDNRLDNDVVDVYARDLASFLWRCGYRRISKQAEGLNS